MRQSWELGDQEKLAAMWGGEGATLESIALALGKTAGQVSGKASRMGLPDRRTTIWTAEREEHLRARWAEKVSPNKIADELGNGITRSAVVSKALRLKLPLTSTNKDKDEPESRIKITAQNHVLEVFDKPVIEIPDDQSRDAVSFFDNLANKCRYPLNSVEEVGIFDFRFCGSIPLPECPYCSRHARHCFKPRKKEKRNGTETHASRAGGREDRPQQQFEQRREAEALGIHIGD